MFADEEGVEVFVDEEVCGVGACVGAEVFFNEGLELVASVVDNTVDAEVEVGGICAEELLEEVL